MMNAMNECYQPTKNPMFQGKELVLPAEIPNKREKNIVCRPRDTLFNYLAWPSVCSDENGTLYATSAWGMEHICPFTKYSMYISKDGGKHWSPPIAVVDSYLPDGHGGILYLGDGKLLLSWGYHPGDVIYNTYYHRICGNLYGGKPDKEGSLRGAMMDLYSDLPVEKMVGGSFVKMSEDYGITWSDPIRVPIHAPHGPCKCKDGTLIYLGKEYYPDPQGTFDAFSQKEPQRIQVSSYQEWIDKLENTRCGKESGVTPIYAYASMDGGYTWEKRGLCNKPEFIKWFCTHEPHVVELNDGSLLGAIRVENERDFENEMVIYTTRSNDGGYTWSAWECTHINGGPPHLMQKADGTVLLSVGRRTGGGRLGEFVLQSNDNGKTWVREFDIDGSSPDGDLGYPATAEMPDGNLVTVYYQKYIDPETGIPDKKPCIQCVIWRM